MRVILLSLLLVLMAIGCNSSSQTDSFSADGRKSDTSDTSLFGDYYQGDGLGYNLHLTLSADGKFKCDWSGCLGKYGATEGTWSRAGDKIVVTVAKADGMFTDRPLENMTIVRHGNENRLMFDSDADLRTEPEMFEAFSFARTDHVGSSNR